MLSVNLDTIYAFLLTALLSIIEPITAKAFGRRDDKTKFADWFEKKLRNTMITMVALQCCGTRRNQLVTNDGDFFDVNDYIGPKSFMQLIAFKDIYAVSASIYRAAPAVTMSWTVGDFEGKVLSPQEFNAIWADFNSGQKRSPLPLDHFKPVDVSIQNFAAAYIGDEATFVRLDGEIEPIISHLLGLKAKGTAQQYVPIAAPSDEEVRLWIIGSGISTEQRQ